MRNSASTVLDLATSGTVIHSVVTSLLGSGGQTQALPESLIAFHGLKVEW